MRDARDRLGKGMDRCVLDCRECQDACTRTVQHCLRTGGLHAEARHIRLLSDCAELCQTAGNFVSRTSDHHAAVCALCAAVCEACAASCERIGDEAMRACAAACRRCAQSCREVAA